MVAVFLPQNNQLNPCIPTTLVVFFIKELLSPQQHTFYEQNSGTQDRKVHNRIFYPR